MDLVDARYLVALGEAGGVVPRWQELPQEARITPARLWWLRGWTWTFTLPVLVLSYPWLDREHPDRLGEQLRRIVPILSALLASAREVGGEHQTVGVAWDYACLPQKPYATDGEHERFKRGLSAINRWYSHPHTIVLLCTGALPTGTAYRSVRPYEARGWCRFEIRISSVVKHKNNLWDLSRYAGAADLYGCARQMKACRPPPMSPNQVAREIRDGVSSGELAFTASADMDLVLTQYCEGFERAISAYRETAGTKVDRISYGGIGWTADEFPVVRAAIVYALERCRPVTVTEFWLAGNFDELMLAEIQDMVAKANVPNLLYRKPALS